MVFTAFRWALAVAGGFTAMALFLFAFIYSETAMLGRIRIDAMVVNQARLIAQAPPGNAAALLDRWLAEDLHNVRYGGLFGQDGAHARGNLLALPDALPPDGLAHRAIFSPIDRDRDGDDPEVVRGVGRRLGDGQLLILGYDIDDLEDMQNIILRALGLGLVPAVLMSLTGGMLLALRAQRRIAAVHQVVGQIMQGRLRERLPVRGAWDELESDCGRERDA